MPNGNAPTLVWLSTHHVTLTLIIFLFVLVLVAAGLALASGVRSRRHRNKDEAYSEYVDELEKQAEKLANRLGRGCFGYRSMSACLAAIEVVGGAYFAVTGSSIATTSAAANQNNGRQVTVATLIGFAIIVTSAIQSRVHPYTKAVELRFRRWNLDFIADSAHNARLEGVGENHVARVLINAIREATKPFSDRPDQTTPREQNLFPGQPREAIAEPPQSNEGGTPA